MSKNIKNKLKNYTTSVPAERSIVEIERYLVDFGATAIMKEWDNDKKVISIAFKIKEAGFKLPANTEGVAIALFGHNLTEVKKKQAERTAWRILKDWIHAQMSIVVSGLAEPEQVLLPYMYDGKLTLYQKYKEGKLMLEDNKPEVVE